MPPLSRSLVFLLSPLVLSSGVANAEGILYIGDSQSAAPAGIYTQLQSTIKSHGSVRSFGVCGAPIEAYTSASNETVGCKYKGAMHLDFDSSRTGDVPFKTGPGVTSTVETLMSTKTDTVVVELGDNNLKQSDKGASAAAELVRKILAKGKSCVWIGPASISDQRCSANRAAKRATSEAIKAILARTVVNGKTCEFVDSWTATSTKPMQGDSLCIHYAKYTNWGDAIREPLDQAIRNAQAQGQTSPNSSTLGAPTSR